MTCSQKDDPDALGGDAWRSQSLSGGASSNDPTEEGGEDGRLPRSQPTEHRILAASNFAEIPPRKVT